MIALVKRKAKPYPQATEFMQREKGKHANHSGNP